MPGRWFVLLLLAPLAMTNFAAAKDPSEYAGLLASLKAGNTDIDYTRLRISYMESPERQKAKDVSNPEKAMFKSLSRKDFPEALKVAETVLASEYINMDAHFIAAMAHREMGDTERAEFHRTVFRSLIDSIRNSGDGKSMETAWVVVTVHEEYVVLRALGYQPSGQALLEKDGHSYDQMKVKNAEDGTEQTIYFNIDIALKHEL
jgi:hypothetical protein